MKILNQTIFQFASNVGKVDFPKHSLTLIVKGTFDLSPEKQTTFSEEQWYPNGDEFYVDDEEMQGGARYTSDFAYFKPCADLILVGKCHAPNGEKVPACNVTFQVGSKSKTLNVFGNRYWRRGLLGSFSSDPEPFSNIELRYENSFGGEGYTKNPVGKGINKVELAVGKKMQPLPNIVSPKNQITSPNRRTEPAGFGPIGRMWQHRYSKLGTYKANYLKESWPWFPKDFDWSYYNAAPDDMWIEGYLRGDEELFFENLHPVHSQYRSQLPGLRVRCFLNEIDGTNRSEKPFREVPLKLDTLWVDMEDEKLVLVWRGVTNVISEEYEEIQHVFIVSEKLDETLQSIDYYHEQFITQIAELEEEELQLAEPVIEEEVKAYNVDDEIAKAEAAIRAELIKAGVDPDEELPPPSEEAKKKEEQLLKELGIEEEKKEEPLTREIVQERAVRKDNFAGEDLSGIDLSELDLQEIDFQQTILFGALLNKANLSRANLSRANLAESDLSGANLRNAILKDADLTGANLAGADLTSAVLDDAIFEKAILKDAIINQANAANTIFAEANIDGASMVKCDLQGADFSNSNLNKTNFQGSNLRNASVEGAIGVQVNMSEADLTELRASEGCNFTRGFFHKAVGDESIWEKANLTGADFSFSIMTGADFAEAMLGKANFSYAQMKSTRFTKANLQEANFKVMNLFQGSLEKADITGADFSGSNLYGVEFLDAVIDKTKFDYANLKMSKLYQK